MATAISPLKHVCKQITNAQFVQIYSVYVATICGICDCWKAVYAD